MDNQSQEIKTLKLIKVKLDKLMNDRYTKVKINSSDLYGYIKNDSELFKIFPNSRRFNQFIRTQYENGLMKQFISNCHADTTKRSHYEWSFWKEIKSSDSHSGKNTNATKSNYKYHSFHKNVVASNNEIVRSLQEKFIYEKLLICDNLELFYDHPIRKNEEVKYTDFYIRKKINHQVFYWEHFGMTNDENYKNGMAEAINWYKTNGFKTVEDGGNLIYTYYSDEKTFNRDVLKYIDIIKAT
jgi:hypothetical protein